MIPKIAHFIWFGTPPEWVNNVIREFTDLHPGWDVKLHTAIPASMPEAMRKRLLPCDQICQWADILAVWLLFNEGGIYLDTDAIAIRNFEPLLNLEAFTSPHNDNDKRLTNGLMGSAKGSPAFAYLVDWICKWDPPMRREKLAKRCYYGPDMLTEVFIQEKTPGMTVLPWHYFYPYTYDERGRAAECWRSDPSTRLALVDELRSRFSDGVPPYAIHLWGVDGSSHKEASDVTQYFSSDQPIDPAGEARDRDLAAVADSGAVPGPADQRSRGRSQKGRAGVSAAAGRSAPAVAPG